jgi:hypothetical protein
MLLLMYIVVSVFKTAKKNIFHLQRVFNWRVVWIQVKTKH